MPVSRPLVGVPEAMLTWLIALWTTPERPMLLLLFKLDRWLYLPDSVAVCVEGLDGVCCPGTLTSFRLSDRAPLFDCSFEILLFMMTY